MISLMKFSTSASVSFNKKPTFLFLSMLPAKVQETASAVSEFKQNDRFNKEFRNAVKAGDLPIVESLFETGRIDINKADEKGIPPLVHAIFEMTRGFLCKMKPENYGLFAYLLSKGANPNVEVVRDGVVDTLFHMVCRSNHPLFVWLMLCHGALVDQKNGRGETALAESCGTNDRTAIVQLLLKNVKMKADPNSLDNNNVPVLAAIVAKKRIHDRVAKAVLLLDRGVKFELYPPLLHGAINVNDKELVELFLKHDVDTRYCNNQGITPFYDAIGKYAYDNCPREIINVLANHFITKYGILPEPNDKEIELLGIYYDSERFKRLLVDCPAIENSIIAEKIRQSNEIKDKGKVLKSLPETPIFLPQQWIE